MTFHGKLTLKTDLGKLGYISASFTVSLMTISHLNFKLLIFCGHNANLNF